jgi:ABC-type multidrug transport system ATPase subunit
MISLQQLTKRYGSFTAVDAINLEVPRPTGPARRRRCA